MLHNLWGRPAVCAGPLDPLFRSRQMHPAPPREQRGHTAGRYNGRAYEDDRRLSHCPHSRSSRRAGRHACPDSSACLAPGAVGRVPPACRHSHRGSPRRSRSAPSRRLPCQRARRAHRLAVEGLRIGPFLRPPQRHRAGLKRTVYCPRPSRGLRTGGHHARRTHPIPNAGGLVLRRPDAAPTPSSGNRKPDAPRRRLRHALRPHRRLPPHRMARYKMNVFHWHLTDDNGWRIEIKGLPQLTQVGAWRVPRLARWGTREPPREGEAATEGGFYTQDDIREVVAYARQRFVTVVPEIEMPGHSLAALAAYPELSCTGGPFQVNPGSN